VEFDRVSNSWSMSARTYIKNVTEKIEALLDVRLKCYGSPMESGDHPETDDSDLLFGKDISSYQMLIGSAQWAIRLGRFDVQYATNTLARYANMPRQGHYDRALRIFGYLKHNAKARILFDPKDMDLSQICFERHDWTDLYPKAKEATTRDMPKAKTRKVQITAMVDASHASDIETRRSVTGYLYLSVMPLSNGSLSDKIPWKALLMDQN